MYFRTGWWGVYWSCSFSNTDLWITSNKTHLVLFIINIFLFIFTLVLFYMELHYSFISADDIIHNINTSLNSGFTRNPSRFIFPKTQYQSELMQHFYSPEPMDPNGYYMEMYRIFNTNERYFIYWYLTYSDVVVSSDLWTEASIHKECLNLNMQYMVKIVLAAKEYFPEFSSDWMPPDNYLNSKTWHPWLQYGPNFYGVMPPEQVMIAEPTVEEIVENMLMQQQTPPPSNVLYQDCSTPYEKIIFNRYKDSSLFNQLFHIYTSNERYLLYWYVSHCDLAMHSSPWDELLIQKACLDYADPQFIVNVVNTGKTYIAGFSDTWRPPFNYLTEKVWHPWLTHVPNFTGMTAEEIALSYNPSNQDERAFLMSFFVNGDKNTFEHLYHIFFSNEKFLVYQYMLYYDPVLLPKASWTEDDLFRMCLSSLDPQFMMDIVTAAKSHWHDFSSEWSPDPDYLEFRQWEPWMDFGPSMLFSSGAVWAAVIVVFCLFSLPTFGKLFENE